ncbi:hypothetical protein PR048_018505 [Dryococelus australis]|uniref:Mutator-like transposase domain-containing protein n=1 Tax=Dryococelus australis TaxID=614101 RepID=A0ABQ9HCG2_9NEOP|nr:hypothetical protein PR048_018505 [Dryococelus australis]
MRAIGKSLSATQTFCALMNLPPPPTRIQKYYEIIGDIPIAFDGTWQKRRHASKNPVATLTSIDTVKVIDVGALTKHCYCFDGNTSGEHKNCQKNYEGTSEGMEADAAVKIFRRSVLKRGVRYVQFLGDGNFKAYKSVWLNQNHIRIRWSMLDMHKTRWAHTSKNKQTLRTTVLSDGKLLRSRLTDTTINELRQYYGMAIRNNTHDLASMRKAVWATYFHKLSNNWKPIHSLCPSGPNT